MTDEYIRISASDVADYVYCTRCWYRRLRGLLPAKGMPDAMIQGAVHHTHLADTLDHHTQARTILWAVIVLAAVIGVGLIVLGVILH